MSDLISKSAALDNAWQVMYKDEWHISLPEQVVSVNDIEALPNIDAVPVVRCKDCEFYTEEELWCRRLGLCGAFDPNGYCSHAERSGDGDT